MQSSTYARVVERFMPSDVDDDVDAYGQTVVLLGVYFVSIAAAFVLTLLLSIAPLESADKITAVLISALTLVGYCVGLGCFLLFTKFSIGVTAYSISVLFNICSFTLVAGGFSSAPHLLLIFILPVWSYLMLGGGHGLIWSLFAGLSVVTAYALEASGVQAGQLIAPNYLAIFKLQSILVTLSLIAICMYTYESNYSALRLRLLEERSKFAYEALHDSLTGLCNRKLFYKRAKEAIEQSLESDNKAAILYLDLDSFKQINDTRGHDIGDVVLKEIAIRLQSVVRSSDTVARLGGDEFAVVLLAMRGDDTEKIISKKIIAQFERPLQVASETLTISGSLGVAVCPYDSTQLDKLIKCADEAMYAAKRNKMQICYAADRDNQYSATA